MKATICEDFNTVGYTTTVDGDKERVGKIIGALLTDKDVHITIRLQKDMPTTCPNVPHVKNVSSNYCG
jgi:hypothetical protein